MSRLSARTIANNYSLAEIEAKITKYETILDNAAEGGYTLDTTAGRQSVVSPDPRRVEELLQAWLKARDIKRGIKQTHLYSGDYMPRSGPV